MARAHYELAGRTVLITGAARGIGAEAARQLAARGANLALVGLEPDGLERVANECGDNAAWWEGDVRDRDAIIAAVEGVAAHFGGIDVVIANAGIAPVGTVETIEPDDFEATIDVNLLGVWRTVRAALPHVIARQGYVLPIASLAAALHAPLMAPYTAAKAGVEAFGDSLRSEVRHHGVDVGVAYFGFIDTDMVRDARAHPATADVEDRLGSLGAPLPVAAAGEAIVRGIERRARHVVAPRWVGPALTLRTVLQPLVERAQRRQGIDEVVRRANELARRARASANGH